VVVDAEQSNDRVHGVGHLGKEVSHVDKEHGCNSAAMRS
jgi:hypothetical protein